MEERSMSNHYGLYELGYGCVTMVVTKRREKVIWSKSLKITLVRIAS
jgi:hypothetical protein